MGLPRRGADVITVCRIAVIWYDGRLCPRHRRRHLVEDGIWRSRGHGWSIARRAGCTGTGPAASHGQAVKTSLSHGTDGALYQKTWTGVRVVQLAIPRREADVVTSSRIAGDWSYRRRGPRHATAPSGEDNHERRRWHGWDYLGGRLPLVPDRRSAHGTQILVLPRP